MCVCRLFLSLGLSLAAGLVSGCHTGRPTASTPEHTGGSASAGKEIIATYKCGQCHNIPGVHGANGVFGPPLSGVARLTYIAGNFPNTPDNLEHWVMSPKTMKPRTAMPVLGLDQQQARDVAAYLYTLR